MIRKIIHYCWFGPKPMSRTVKCCMATWHTHLKEYEICLWNEHTCSDYAAQQGIDDPMEHPFVRAAYKAGKYAFVADYIRFWVLYHVGGIYLDTDMYVVRPLDDLLDNVFFTAWETELDAKRHAQGSFISCGAMGACAMGACAMDILAVYDNLQFDPAFLNQFIVPRIITPVLLRHPECTIYPYDYFYPLPYEERFVADKMQYNTHDTYAVHLWDYSWGNKKVSLLNRLAYYWRQIRPKQ